MTAIKHILVPIDFSAGSVAALRQAVALAEAFDARIDLLHVWEPAPAVTPAQLGWMAADADTFCARVEDDLGERLEEMVEEQVPEARERIHLLVEAGYVAHTILEKLEHEGYDLVVMGTHGRRGLKHLVLGSVAERVVRAASCPVMTLHAAETVETSPDDSDVEEHPSGPELETPTHL